MGGRRTKSAYAVGLGVEEIIRLRKGLPVWGTLTFEENITDKREAQRRLRALKERMRREWPGLRFVGVWQRQKRGAWHFHFLADRWLDVHVLRKMCLETGWGPFCNLKVVERLKDKGWVMDGKTRVVDYMTRYLTRDMEQDKGVRLVEYMGPRVSTTSFGWARGFGFLYRAGRQAWSDMFVAELGQPDFDDYWFIVRLGFEVLSPEQQEWVLRTSVTVLKWWDPDAFPF